MNEANYCWVNYQMERVTRREYNHRSPKLHAFHELWINLLSFLVLRMRLDRVAKKRVVGFTRYSADGTFFWKQCMNTCHSCINFSFLCIISPSPLLLWVNPSITPKIAFRISAIGEFPAVHSFFSWRTLCAAQHALLSPRLVMRSVHK